MKLIGYILFQTSQPLPSQPNPCYNTITMKNKNRLHPTLTTKTATRYPKNIHPKTDHIPAQKKDTKNNFFLPQKTPKKPTSITHKPSQALTLDQQHKKDTVMLQNNTVLYLF